MNGEIWLKADTEAGALQSLEILGVVVAGSTIPGAGFKVWPVGSLREGSDQLNGEVWTNVILYAPLNGGWMSGAKDTWRSKAVPVEKPSLNGNPPSKWSERTEASGKMAMFEENGEGGLAPLVPRSGWAV